MSISKPTNRQRKILPVSDDTLKEFQRTHEINAEALKKRQRKMAKTEVEWAEKNGSTCDGRVRRLLQKLNNGTLKTEAFKEAIKVLKDPNRRVKNEYKALFDKLLKVGGGFLNFGENFPAILEAFESKDEDIRELARKFIGEGGEEEKDIQGEREFLKNLSALKKAKLTPDALLRQVQGQVDIANFSGKRKALEVVKGTDLGILPALPEEVRETLAQNVRKFTKYLNDSTQRLDEVRNTLKESQELAASKESLKARLDSDPNFAQELIERTIGDYELLKKTSEELGEAEQNPTLMVALQKFDSERGEYFKNAKPEIFGAADSPHKKFLEAKESEGVRKILMKAIQENLQKFALTALELDVEREIGSVLIEDAEGGEEANESKLNSAILTAKRKYKLDTKVSDLEFLKKLKAKANEYVTYEKENAETRKEYFEMSAKVNDWQNVCWETADDIREYQELLGIKLVETDDGLGVRPREVDIVYADIDSHIDDETGKEVFDKDDKGHVKQYKKEGKITKVEYLPQELEPEERETWRKTPSRPGVLKITVLRADGKEERMSSKDFLEWVRTTDAREKIGTVEELEKRVGFKIKNGTKLLDAADVLTPPRYEVVEIKTVGKDGVTLNAPVNYRPEKELALANTIKAHGLNEVKQELDFGELYSLMARRNLMPLGAEGADLSKLKGTRQEFKYFTGPRGETETRWLRRSGKLGDVLEKYGPTVLAGAPLSSEALEAFKAYPTYDEESVNTNGTHFIKANQPAARLMRSKDKYALAAMQDMEEDEEQPRRPKREKPEEQEEAEEQEKPKEQKEGEGKKHWHEEALAGSELHMEGEAEVESVPWYKKLWDQSRFLASDDIWGLMKAAYEHYERRWHRRSKEKFSTVGEGLPWSYGTEMSRVKQQAEDEEVKQNEEAMENWGIWQVNEALHNAKNKDQLKACFKVLSKKGHVRWDDVKMWESVNRYLPEGLKIPIPPHHNAMFKDKRTGKTGLDYLESALDHLWGQGQYQELMTENDSHYASKMKEIEEKGKRLEGDPKNINSIVGELQILLTKHKKGEYVDPHEYEGLIHFMIKYGKGTMESKVYYIVEGVAVPNPVTGETIMALDRIGSINGLWLNQLPFMDYLTRHDVPRPDGGVSPWTVFDYKKWCDEWDANPAPGKENLPNKNVIEFIWKHVLTDEKTIIRNNKGLRNAENMDHDDAHFIIPLADELLVTDVCSSATGNKRYFTTEGLANTYVGYGQYAKTLAQRGEKAKLANVIRSFARFNAILNSRYKKDSNSFARLGPSFWQRPSVVDRSPVGMHKDQMQNLTMRIAQAYGDAELMEMVQLMHTDVRSTTKKENKEKQEMVQGAIDDFGTKFDEVIRTDGGEKMMQVVNSFGLTGQTEVLSEREKTILKQQMGTQDELGQVFTDWKRGGGD